MLQCHISRALGAFVAFVHKPFNFLRSQLARVKDKAEDLKKCGTVCHIHCVQYDKEYVDETSFLLETRVREHLSRNSSAVHKHCQFRGYSVDSSKTKFLATESNTLAHVQTSHEGGN